MQFIPSLQHQDTHELQLANKLICIIFLLRRECPTMSKFLFAEVLSCVYIAGRSASSSITDKSKQMHHSFAKKECETRSPFYFSRWMIVHLCFRDRPKCNHITLWSKLSCHWLCSWCNSCHCCSHLWCRHCHGHSCRCCCWRCLRCSRCCCCYCWRCGCCCCCWSSFCCKSLIMVVHGCCRLRCAPGCCCWLALLLWWLYLMIQFSSFPAHLAEEIEFI